MYIYIYIAFFDGMQARMPELRKLLDEILPLKTWKEIEARFVAFRKHHKFVPKKNVMFHLYKAQEVEHRC